MALSPRRCKPACMLALAAAFALSGCAGAAAEPSKAVAAAAVLPAAASDDNDSMLAYLNSTLDDFKVIDDCFSDPSFASMLGEDSSGEGADEADPVEAYLGILGDYGGKVKARLAVIQSREAPNHPDVAFFQASETSEFETASDVIGEFMQILRYSDAVEIMNADMQKIGSIKASDLQGIDKTKSSDIATAIDELKSQEVPSFLKSINDSMLDALNQMNDAVLYAQDAVKLKDPVRSNAAEYRWGILVRRFKQVYEEVRQDSSDRKARLGQDIADIRQTNDGLRGWVRGNIGKLSGR